MTSGGTALILVYMADIKVFECRVRRTKAQIRLTGQSAALGRVFRNSPELRNVAQRFVERRSYDIAAAIPASFWSQDLIDGHTVQLERPLPQSELENLCEAVKFAAIRLLNEYATPYEATITITRGDL